MTSTQGYVKGIHFLFRRKPTCGCQGFKPIGYHHAIKIRMFYNAKCASNSFKVSVEVLISLTTSPFSKIIIRLHTSVMCPKSWLEINLFVFNQ